MHLKDGALHVAAGAGTVLGITELQFEGKRRISVTEAVNGGSLTLDGSFGS